MVAHAEVAARQSTLVAALNTEVPARKRRRAYLLENLPYYAGGERGVNALETDLKVLRRLGIDVTCTPDPDHPHNPVYGIAPGDATPLVQFSPEESVYVRLAADAFVPSRGVPRSPFLDWLAPSIELGGEAIEGVVVAELRDAAQLGTVMAAVSGRRVIDFDYRSRRGEVTRRHVYPYRVAQHNDALYMRGWDESRGDLRTFKLGRIEGRIRMGEPEDPAAREAHIAAMGPSDTPIITVPVIRPRIACASPGILSAAFVAAGEDAGMPAYLLEAETEEEWLSRLLACRVPLRVLEPASLAEAYAAALARLAEVADAE